MKIVNKHIELQSEAIKRFGVEESVQYLRARLNSDKSNELIIFRGLVLSGDVEIFETLKKRYEKTKNLDYLEDIYILKNNLTRDYVKLKLSEIDNKLKFIPKFLREGFSTSLSAQILVAPILYFTFGYFSIWSPIINGLVLWVVPYITVLGMISSVFVFLSPLLARILLLLTYPLTYFFISVVSLFARL